MKESPDQNQIEIIQEENFDENDYEEFSNFPNWYEEETENK